jgi:hypothetical protein
LLNKCGVYLYFDALHIDLLGPIPTAHLRQHLGGFKAITRASLWQTCTGCVDNVRENPDKLVPCHRSHFGLSVIPGLELFNSLRYQLISAQAGCILWTFEPNFPKRSSASHAAGDKLGELFVSGVS